MFVAQLSAVNSCTVPEGVDVEYPNPGEQVERVEGKLGAPVGDCGASSGGSPPATSAGETSAPASSAPASSAPAETSAPATSAPATTSAPPASTSAPAGGDGACTAGEVRCDSESTWSQCGSGAWISMGAVPGGMVCKDGQITAAARKRSLNLKSHRRHWNSRAL